jgi:hypothetical protein
MDMHTIDQIVRRMASEGKVGATVIVCLFTGRDLPPHCAPMLREPAPETGMSFDITFPAVLMHAIAQNPSVHDGAVMVGRERATSPYRIAGWSFRLFPKSEGPKMAPNRGSAFNSASAMSRVESIDAVYLISAENAYRFKRGASAEIILGTWGGDS